MLKSHFNIAQNDGAEEMEQEQELAELAVEGEQMESEMMIHTEMTSYPEMILKKSQVSVNLSLLGKTAEGDGYTYLKATLTGMGLTNINAIKHFRHLQFVDVSQNNLDLNSLQIVTELPYLLLIHADHNLIRSAALKKCKYLQVMIFNHNQIKSVEDVFQPELSTLEVGYNNIHRIQFKNRMSNVRCLDFRYNYIDDISDINFPMLDSLYLAGNRIKSLVGLEKLINLRILHLRNNPIRLLDGFAETMAKLQYINLRNCKVSTLKQVKKLKVLPALESLTLKGCPYMGGTGDENTEAAQEEEDPELRIEVLATMSRLKKLNKNVYTPEERAEAKELMMQWIEEGEKSEDEEDFEEEEHKDTSSNVDL